jgi:competence protein ComFC
MINPTRIPGRWRIGYALDYHTVSSLYVGDDEFSHPIFDTKRTEIGELLYRLKYKSDLKVLENIVNITEEFLRSWNPPIELIVPVPPTKLNRTNQPVLIIAKSLGERLKLPVIDQAISRLKQIPELKTVYDFEERLRLLDKAFEIDSSWVGENRVLLFDDLFRSGATMNAITAMLYDKGFVNDVYALTITRTRSVR